MLLKSIRLVFLVGGFATSFFSAKADKYPKNYSIDVIHYNFTIKLSDSTDAIQGEAAITIKFKKSDVKNIRLDLINKSISRKDKGMLVRSIYSNGELLPQDKTRQDKKAIGVKFEEGKGRRKEGCTDAAP